MPRERWNYVTLKRDMNGKVEEFLGDIEQVCRSHGISISHEDHHGAFIATDFNERDCEWLKSCGIKFKADEAG